MSSTESDPEDATTKEEITGAAPAPEPSSTGVSRGTKRNACKPINHQPGPESDVIQRGSHSVIRSLLAVVAAFALALERTQC